MEDDELRGAVKNGLDRGESLENIRGSLLNAGYDRDKVESVLQNAGSSVAYKSQPDTQQKNEMPVENSQQIPEQVELGEVRGGGYPIKKLPNIQVKENSANRTRVIIILIVSLMILAAAGFLAWFYWDWIVSALS